MSRSMPPYGNHKNERQCFYGRDGRKRQSAPCAQLIYRREFAVPNMRVSESNADDRRDVVAIGGSFEISNAKGRFAVMRNIKLDRRGILIVGGVAAAGAAAYGVAGAIGVAKRCSEFTGASEGAVQSARRIGLAYLRV